MKTLASVSLCILVISCNSIPRDYKNVNSTLIKNLKSKRLNNRNLKGQIKSITDYSYSLYPTNKEKKPSTKRKEMLRLFDRNGNIIEKTHFHQDSIITHRLFYSYNQNGQLIEYKRFNKSELEQSRHYQYNEAQEHIESKNFNKNIGWRESKRTIFPEVNMIQWTELKKDIKFYYQRDYYNNINQLIAKVNQNGILRDSVCYRYNNKGLKTRIREFQFDGTLETETRITYDSHNNSISNLTFSNKGEFIKGTKYSHNDNNDIIRISRFSGSNEVENEEYKYKYDYKHNWIYLESRTEDYRIKVTERKIEYY